MTNTTIDTEKPTIALLGTGNMGFPMARRLCEAGYRMHAWNRTRSRAAGLSAFGASVFDSAQAAVADADITISMLENGAVVGAVLFDPHHGAATHMRKGSLFVDMASILPKEAQAHAAQLQMLGLAHIDAPVSGGTLGAENGSLAIMAGGVAAAVERAAPVLAHLGRLTHVGPSGSGQLAKLANQMIVGITIGAVAEALLLCERGGADPAKVREAIMGGFAESRVLQVHGERMVQHDFAARARLAIQLKDMKNAMQTAHEATLDLPISTLLTQCYTQACEQGYADMDQAALYDWLQHRA